MKRIFTLVVIAISLLTNNIVKSQTTHPFELGFNVGASWLQSDVKMKKLGLGGGFTFGQMYGENATNIIDWGWRFRYLSATTYGQNKVSSSGIMNNNALNGVIDTTLDYYSNGGTNDGIVYHNYKTKISECSVELLFGANRMRERTHVYPYIFGGIGLTKAAATMNQLNTNGARYDYHLIDSTGGSVSDFLDGDYESKADGNQSPSWKFMPSIGVGLGFEVTKGFSIGFEHKMTWGLNDVLDGQQWSDANLATGNNDKYHYSSVWLKFSFGRAAHHTSSNTTTTTNTTTTDANTYTTTGNEKPTIQFTNPASGSATVSNQAYTVTAKITNVNSISDITFSGNGSVITNFTYNSSSDVFACPVTLANGVNNFVITATNIGGSTNGSATVSYSVPVVVPAPIVTITNPSVNPYNTTNPVGAIVGTVQGINSMSDMHVAVNGVNTTNFIYNPSSHGFSINYNLGLGSTTFVVSANNAGGSDSKSTVINLQSNPSNFSGPAPVVTFITPSVNPYSTNMNSTNVVATAINVTSGSQVTVMVNGANAPYNFNAVTHQVTLSANLITGSNTVTISATNANGGDSKTESIIYAPITATPKPVVSIINPSTSPYNTNSSPQAIEAGILNVTAMGQISVLLNGSPVPTSALHFNPSTHSLTFNVNLIAGANTVLVSATNVSGSDSKTETIIYTAPAVVVVKPVVTITTPSVNPYTTTASPTGIVATVLNVSVATEISANLNGVNVPFSFNSATHQLTMNAPLVVGNNILTITATNSAGSDSKTETIIYSQPVVVVPAPIVTITSPATNPFNTTIGSVTVNATIMNITSASQVSVTLNGVATNAFTFLAPAHHFGMNATLITGANVVVISATNTSGSDSKTETIIYTAPPPVLPPVVTFTAPASSPFSSSTVTYTIKATVLNVTNASQIKFYQNAVLNAGFSFLPSTHVLTFNANMSAGVANTFKVFATNTAGRDSATVIIKVASQGTSLTPVPTDSTGTTGNPNDHGDPTTGGGHGKPVKGGPDENIPVHGVEHEFTTSPNAPTITLINPTMNTLATTNIMFNVSMTVDVPAIGNIVVKKDGVVITGFTFDVATKKIVVPSTLHKGMNNITVEATNGSGTRTQIVSLDKK